MTGPVAMITGAGRGIGRATAIELGKKGYRLAVISRTTSELNETAAMCGQNAKTFVCDVSDRAQVDKLTEEVMRVFGRVDALVHCAGMVVSRSIEEMTPEEWRSTFDTNLSAIYFLCRRLWPVWRRQGGGVIVNVSSEAARDPFPGLGVYGAAKAAVNLLGKALAREGAEHGIRVHTVAPAATETAMLRSLFSDDELPKERTLQPEAVGRVIAQCVCGDLACTSGEVIYVHK
jgi:NAD(P)-dependent dehydrogenase (short-subunit alcohol dehydrogenase family)